MGFNPYQGGVWQPNAQQYYNNQYTAYPQQNGIQSYPYNGTIPTYNGAMPNMQRSGRTNVIRVSGPESAKSYPMGPGDVMVMFDESNAVFYFVTADDSGFKSMETCDFFIREKSKEAAPQTSAVPTDTFATKEDLDAIGGRIGNIEKMLEGLM